MRCFLSPRLCGASFQLAIQVAHGAERETSRELYGFRPNENCSVSLRQLHVQPIGGSAGLLASSFALRRMTSKMTEEKSAERLVRPG